MRFNFIVILYCWKFFGKAKFLSEYKVRMKIEKLDKMLSGGADQTVISNFTICYVHTGPFPNGSGPTIGPERPSVYTGLFWNQSEQIQKWACCFAGPLLGAFRTRSRKVPSKHLDRFQKVPCKRKPIQSGPL